MSSACWGLVLVGVLTGCSPPPQPTTGHLLPCPSSDNCVNSEADSADTVHSIAPLAPPTGHSMPNDALARLRGIVLAMPRTTIVGGSPTTLRATFSSRIFGFTDDVEFRVDPKLRVIQVRSASRRGYGDLGVNRERVEAIRAAWDATFEETGR